MKNIIIIFIMCLLIVPNISLARYSLSKKEFILSKYELKSQSKGAKYIKQIDAIVDKYRENGTVLLKLKDKIDALEEKIENDNSRKGVQLKQILKYLNLKIYFALGNDGEEFVRVSPVSEIIEESTITESTTGNINPEVSVVFKNDTGKIITEAHLAVSIIDDEGKNILTDTKIQYFSPGLLPGKEENGSFELGYKWTSDALQATLGLSEVETDRFIVKINKVKDIDNQTYYLYSMTSQHKAEIKEQYTEIQDIASQARVIREQINAGNLDSETLDDLNSQLSVLVAQSNELDPNSWISLEYYDISEAEVAEGLIIIKSAFIPEN